MTLTDEQREELEDALHNALCDCRDRGTGFVFRSADGRKATDALAPLIARMVAEAEQRGRAEVSAAVGAVLTECEDYPEPQTCITAGPEALAADGCQPCRVSAVLFGGTP